MTEWEQIKKEYREIPIPTDGPHQMLEAIADAKRKRKRNSWKHIAKYGSIVAAAMLVVIILPGILLFSGGFGGSNDMAVTESAVSKEDSIGSDGWFTKDSAESVMEDINMAPAADTEYNNKTNAGGSSENGGMDFTVTPAVGQNNPEQSKNNTELKKEEVLTLPLNAISAEILRQMEERMKAAGETYYIKSEAYPEGFEKITEEQEYYINEDGLFVIVFETGKVAPEEQGIVEFVIPAEVAVP